MRGYAFSIERTATSWAGVMCHFKRIIDKKQKVRGILYYKAAVRINNITFSKHNDIDKGQVMMVLHDRWMLKEISHNNLRVRQTLTA